MSGQFFLAKIVYQPMIVISRRNGKCSPRWGNEGKGPRTFLLDAPSENCLWFNWKVSDEAKCSYFAESLMLAGVQKHCITARQVGWGDLNLYISEPTPTPTHTQKSQPALGNLSFMVTHSCLQCLHLYFQSELFLDGIYEYTSITSFYNIFIIFTML